MKVIVGLGNPGTEYENTRHNFGFLAVLDFYQHHADIFSAWKEKFDAKISEGTLNGEKVILMLPQTFMNDSGRAVAALAKYFKLSPGFLARLTKKEITFNDVWIIHDDIDLPIGATRLSFGAESGGHKGVASIIVSLRTKNFVRFRLGIHSPQKNKTPTDRFVLGKFTEEENQLVKETLHKTVSALEGALQIGVARVMNEYNR